MPKRRANNGKESRFSHSCPSLRDKDVDCPGRFEGERIRQRLDGVTKVFKHYLWLGLEGNKEYFVFKESRD